MPPVMLATHSPSHPPRSPLRKSPPPPPLNLDDCKSQPILATTRTNTSSNSSSSGSTAFVFTSSRHHIQYPSNPSTPGSPELASSGSVHSLPASHHHRPRASLTQSQLAKHSEGAIDARTVLGPNMRAAGFVHLAHTVAKSPHHHPSPTSPPSTPGSSHSHPTPTDPPPFPPIMFVSPSSVTSQPMWEYQRGGTWPLGSERARMANASSDVGVAAQMGANAGAKPFLEPSYSASTLFSPASITASSSFYSSTSTLRSSPPPPKPLELSPVLHRPKESKPKGKEVLSEYPFPRTVSTSSAPPAIQPQSSSKSASHHTDAPSFVSVTSHHYQAMRTPRRIDKEKERYDKPKEKTRENTKEKDKQAKAKDMVAPPSAPASKALSITQLCDFSASDWIVQSASFLPPPPRSESASTRSASRTSSKFAPSASSGSSRGKESEKPPALEDLGLGLSLSVVTESAEREGQGQGRSGSEGEARLVPAKASPTKAHHHRVRGRTFGGPPADPERQREKEHLTALVHAHRERDREHARHVAADREKRRHSYGFGYARSKAKSVVSDAPSDAETMVDSASVLMGAISELEVCAE